MEPCFSTLPTGGLENEGSGNTQHQLSEPQHSPGRGQNGAGDRALSAEALNVDTAGQSGKKAAFVTPGLQPLSWENKL